MAKKKSSGKKWILYLVCAVVVLFILSTFTGLLIDTPEDLGLRPFEGQSFDRPVIIDDVDPIKGMAKAFAHLEAYSCLDLGGRIEIKDRGLIEKTDHDYYVFTITCVNGEEKFYFQIDNLSSAFKEEGSSIENALIPAVDPSLGPMEKHREGIRLEYAYLMEYACEEKGGIQTTPDGESLWIDQALIPHEDDFYDMMTVHCENEVDEVYYFYTYLKEVNQYMEGLEN